MFNGHSSATTQVSRYQKGKTNVDFTEARDSERQTDRQPLQHPTTQFFYRPDALPAAQPTALKHQRLKADAFTPEPPSRHSSDAAYWRGGEGVM